MDKNQEVNQRILIITYKYAPAIAPRAFRWSSIVKEWTIQGVEVDVICGPNPGSPGLERMKGARVFRVDPWFQRRTTTLNESGSIVSPIPDSYQPMNVYIARKQAQTQEKPSGIIEFLKQYFEKYSYRPFWFSVLGLIWDTPTLIQRSMRKQVRLFFRRTRRRFRGVYLSFRRSITRLIRGRFTIRVRNWKKQRKQSLQLVAVTNIHLRVMRRNRFSGNKYADFRSETSLRLQYAHFRQLIQKRKPDDENGDEVVYPLRWPDYGMFWIPPATLKARRLLQENHYDGVISVSWPVSPHVVGYLINKMGKEPPHWVVDIGDPFSFNHTTPINDFDIFESLNRGFEKRLLEKCSAYAVTTEQTLDLYKGNFPDSSQKGVVIPPLISIDTKQVDLNKTKNGNDQKIRLVYSGSLRRRNRRPDTLLMLFDGLLNTTDLADRLELHFYGDVKQVVECFAPYEAILGSKIFIHGVVAKEVNDQMLAEADVLINIGNKTDYQTPSKVFDYLAMNRPVINFASHEKDTSWSILSRSPMTINILLSGSTTSFQDEIRRVCAFLADLPAPLPEEKITKLIGDFLPEQIARRYMELM